MHLWVWDANLNLPGNVNANVFLRARGDTGAVSLRLLPGAWVSCPDNCRTRGYGRRVPTFNGVDFAINGIGYYGLFGSGCKPEPRTSALCGKRLSVPRYANLFAMLLYLTYRTFGGYRDADVLTVGNQQVVDRKPILGRKFFPQGKFGFVGGFGFDVSPSVGNTVDVGINAYPRFLIAEGNDKVRRFASHTIQLQQFIDFIRYLAFVCFNQFPANLFDLYRLCPVEPNGIDELFHIRR